MSAGAGDGGVKKISENEETEGPKRKSKVEDEQEKKSKRATRLCLLGW